MAWNTLKITSDGETAHLILNGVDISKGCLGFELKKTGCNSPVLSLQILCDELDVSSDGVITNVEKKTATEWPEFMGTI